MLVIDALNIGDLASCESALLAAIAFQINGPTFVSKKEAKLGSPTRGAPNVRVLTATEEGSRSRRERASRMARAPPSEWPTYTTPW